MKLPGCAVLIAELCGCAYLATVKRKPAHLPSYVRTGRPVELAEGYLAAAEHEQPMVALGGDLHAAKISCGVLRWPAPCGIAVFSAHCAINPRLTKEGTGNVSRVGSKNPTHAK